MTGQASGRVIIRMVKVTMYLLAGLAAVLGPVFLLPKIAIGRLLAFMM